MKKRSIFRLITTILLTVLLSVISVLNIFAADFESDGNENEMAVPEYQTVCGNLPYHMMYPAGGCICYYPEYDLYFSNGCMWQCINCYTLLATQNEPGNAAGIPIGKYAVSPWYYSYSAGGICLFYAVSGSYCYGSTLPGYRFNYYQYR